ncbi:uncharacterized protein LOC116429533 [Nomia melanderi]|uniref:uncharacterized protein LOC116429533 n=1 Tax=Nomia melanderi TaxID=2448451 RepID=UPI003FCC7E8B
MTSFYDSRDYYKKMLELQEKLRKSEEERIRLEERFKVLLQESRNRHNTCINRLRFRYMEFLEEQRTTDERNHKLLEALDRVDNSLAVMTARTDRLNILRKHYEAYLRQICATHADDTNDMSSQKSNKYLRTAVNERGNSLPHEPKNIPPTQSFRSNYQTSKPVFSSPSKTTKPMQSTYTTNYPLSSIESKTNQQTNNHSTLQMYPKVQQQQLSLPNLSDFQQSHPYNNNLRFATHDFEIDPKLKILHATPNPQINLSKERAVHFNPFSTQRTVRAVPHFAMSSRINDNNPLDMQNRTSSLQYHISPSYRLQHSNETPLDNLQTRIKSEKFVSFKDTPRIVEYSVSDTPLLNPSLNLDSSPRSNYSDYSFNDSLYSKPYDYYKNKQPEYFVPKYSSDVNANQRSTRQVRAEESNDNASPTSDNEFDRYIDKIRKLHHDLDKQSLEENRQLDAAPLNDTSSAKDKPDEDLTREVKKVLALAENLVTRTMTANGAKHLEKMDDDKNSDLELIPTAQSRAPVPERNHVEMSDAREGRAASMARAEDRISEDITLPRPELDSHENIEMPKNQRAGFIDGAHAAVSSLETENDDSVRSAEGNGYRMAEETKLEQYLLGPTEELEPWNLSDVEKQIKEIDLIGDTEERTTIEELVSQEPPLIEDNMQIEPDIEDVAHNQLDEQNVGDYINAQEVILNDATDEIRMEDVDDAIPASQYQGPEQEDERCLNTEDIVQNVESSNEFDEQKDYEGDEKEESEMKPVLDENEDNEQIIATLEEQNDQHYEGHDQVQDYVHANEAEYSGINEEYNYDQNESYGYDKKEEYQEYADQEYPQESNEQYEGYAGEQYDQYVNDPANMYEQDPNAQYQEEENQKYSYPYNEQYDANQEYVTDGNQDYEASKPEVPEEQEYKTEQEDNQEYLEPQVESKSDEKEDSLEKGDEDQSEKVASKNEPKKKKDVIKSLLDSDTDSTIERNVSNTESDFDFN